MKILLSWLLDYIDCSLADLDIDKIVHLFNIRTAEIESFERIAVPYSSMFLGQATHGETTSVTIFCPELGKNVSMPARSDLVVGKWYLVMQAGDTWRWVLLADFDKEKEGIMPAVHALEVDQKGGWRSGLPTVDYALDVDNKSINHRPDLWGHYGIAREIAAFLNLPLKPLDAFLQPQKVVSYDLKSENAVKDGLAISIQGGQGCPRFAALWCDDVVYQDSDIKLAIRLACVGAKPMNAVVDLTNYVMIDLGHPMHVFDGRAFAKRTMVIRHGQTAETLHLLDGQLAKLTPQDLVVANETQAVSLAGIMGGKDSSYQSTTQSIVLEAAGFDPVMIRKTAQRLKLRSEASMRFEKHLDPMQNIIAIQRFLYLAHEIGVLSHDVSHPIVSVGVELKAQSCTLQHQFIQSRLGMDIKPEFVLEALRKLHFGATYEDGQYSVTIPTARATKDINIAEDVVEEVIRSYGFENIVPEMPKRQMVPFSTQVTQNIRYIKRQLAYAMGMHEVCDYMLYDASWVSRLQVDVHSAVRVKSPLSENWTTLVTSLVPHLLKSVEQNSSQKDHLRFFEYNRTWSKQLHEYAEQKRLAGIIYDKKAVDFYECKAELQSLWDVLGLTVTYRRPATPIPAWYDQHQAAELMVGDRVIGVMGMMSVAWMHKAVDGCAFIFELDGSFLENIKPAQNRFAAWSRFQEVSYDISLFVPLAVSADAVRLAISKAHSDIKYVQVVDFFEKPEWKEHRAVTIRYTMSNLDKTMTKQDLDSIVQAVHDELKEYNVQIR